MNRSKYLITLLLIAAVIVLAIIPLLLNPASEFGGADDAASGAITAIDPNMQPWFHPIWTPPGPETESLLFALQAALGAAFIGYFFGLMKGRRSRVATASTSAAKVGN